MKWFDLSTDKNAISRALSGDKCKTCNHVKKKKNLAYIVRREVSWNGVVGFRVSCQGCEMRRLNELSRECFDCRENKPMKEMSEWILRDPCAPDGDGSLYTCDLCWRKENHQARMKRDGEQSARNGH